MRIKKSVPRKTFLFFNSVFLLAVAFICVLPFVNLLAVSFSSKTSVVARQVTFWPVDFTVSAYSFIMKNSAFGKSLIVSVQRALLGVAVNLTLIVLTAYPLSKPKEHFAGRSIYSWYYVITILFSGGLIPSYMIVRYTGLINSIWALVLPGALPVFSMLVVMNFMRSLPVELEEAAYIDGANHIDTLFRVILPVSTPALATVTLFSFVGHWNSWFDGIIYMNKVDSYPLQSYLQTMVVNPEAFFRNMAITGQGSSEIMVYLSLINARTANAAQLFLATVPILCVYPFLQRYFTTGLILGSVKG